MTVTRMVLHNLAARTLQVGLRAGEATATGLRRAGYAGLVGAVTFHTVPALVVLGGGGGAAVAGGLWLRRKVERWRGDGPVFLQPPTRRAPAAKARRGSGGGAGEIPPGSLVEVAGARPGERGRWQVLSQLPARGRGQGGGAYLVARPRAGRAGHGKPRVIDADRLVVVAPPPPAARPLTKALARDSARGDTPSSRRAALPDPLGRAATLHARSAALQGSATTSRRRAGTVTAVTAAATRARHHADHQAAERAEQARHRGDRGDRPGTRT
jgi:hypothetical protein